jgi:hypothetical protein
LANTVETPLQITWVTNHPGGEVFTALVGARRGRAYSNSGASSICGTSTRPLSVMRISGMTDNGIRLKPI